MTLAARRLEPEAPASIAVAMRDAKGEAIEGLDVAATLEFPTSKRLDHHVALIETGAGEYRADVPLLAGQWDVVIEAKRDGERLFRSRNRVTLP